MYDFIKKAASDVGFDACGVARTTALTSDARYLQNWLAENHHGTMSYLERNFEKRTAPASLVPNCQTVIVVLLNYYSEKEQPPGAPRIAKYAYSSTDYHWVIKEKLQKLERRIADVYGEDCFENSHQHTFVDSAPVLERRWAQRAGLGWIGKHTQLISPELGSFCFIGTLMLNKQLDRYDEPISDRCGRCTKCIDACPTRALYDNGLDARRCISYLTIELKDEIPDEFTSQLSNCVYGCDICANVCPWNKKKAKQHNHPELIPVREIIDWDAAEWHSLTKVKFNQFFKKTSFNRAGFKKIQSTLELLRRAK